MATFCKEAFVAMGMYLYLPRYYIITKVVAIIPVRNLAYEYNMFNYFSSPNSLVSDSVRWLFPAIFCRGV